MKKTFGRLMIAALMLVVFLSVTALAAVTPEDYEPATDGTYSITYGDAVEGQYYSMVVVEGINAAGVTPTISEDTVLYVGQVTAGPGGATFADWAPKTEAPASVYVGTKNASPVLIGYINNNMISVYGTVTSTIPGGTKYEAIVTVVDSSTTEVIDTVTTVNGEYSLYVEENVEYQFSYKMTNHNKKQMTVNYADNTQINMQLNPEAKASGFVYGDADYDYHGDGVADYVDLMIAANATKTGDGAAVTATYIYADGVITGTASDTQGFAVRQVLSFDNTMFNIADVKEAITLPAGAVEKYYNATTKGSIVTVEVVYYNNSPSTNIITIAAPLADGKTTDDFAYNTFTVDSVAYANEAYNYYKVAGQTNNITVVNDLTAHVGKTEIEVTAGEKIYLQDGSVINVNTTGTYEIPADEGYVAVNVGKENQRTYYLDGKDATQVHTDAAVGSDKVELRDRTPVSDGTDKNGLRYEMTHNPAGRNNLEHRITEVGFISTTSANKVTEKLENAGLNTDRNYVTMDAVDVGAAIYGAAYDAKTGTNISFNNENDEAWILKAVFYNIPMSESGVNTVITTRPYYKVNDTYIYGEATGATLAQIAASIKRNTATWDACSDNMKAYVDEILALAGVSDTEVMENTEVIIDITHLFTALGLKK